jgi:hypothetical protein
LDLFHALRIEVQMNQGMGMVWCRGGSEDGGMGEEVGVGLHIAIPDTGNAAGRFQAYSGPEVSLCGTTGHYASGARLSLLKLDFLLGEVVEEELGEPRQPGLKKTQVSTFLSEAYRLSTKLGPPPVIEEFSLDLRWVSE